MKPLHHPLFISLIAIAMTHSASAATGTWTGSPTGTWDTTDVNWSGVTGTPWNNTDNIALFNTATLTATVGASIAANGITFSTSGSLSGGTITLGGTTPTITVDASQTATISSQLAGTTRIFKAGAGTLILNGANTYIGGTTVSEGRLTIPAPTNTTWIKTIVTNAELEFNVATGTPAISGGSYTGTGSIIKTGAGTLQFGSGGPTAQTVALTGANSLVDVQEGILKNDWGNSAWTGNLAGLKVASGAIFDLHDGNARFDELTGSGVIRKNQGGIGTLTFGANDGSGTFSGNITNSTGTFNLTKIGTGTQTLNGTTISYNGLTTVSAGKLILVNSITNGKSFVADSELEFNITTGSPAIGGGTISGSGNVIKSGTGTLQWGGSGTPQTIALTGASSIIDVQAGILKNDWANSAWTNNKAGLNVASGAIFDTWDGSTTVDELTGSGTIRKNWTGTNSITFGINDGSGVFSGTISSGAGTLNLIKAGTGTQTLSGTISTTGTVVVNGGRLKLVDASISKTYETNAELELNVTTGNPAISGGTISGTGNLIKTGAGTLQLGGFGPTAQNISLTGANSVIDVQEGILKNDYFNNGWTTNLAGLTVASGAIFDSWDASTTVDEINGAGVIRKSQGGDHVLTIGVNNGSGSFAGQISNTGGSFGLVKQGTGTQTLAGNNTYNGPTTVNAGKLLVTGSITSSAVSVSNSGTILASGPSATIGNSLAINSGAILAPGDAAAAGTITVSGATTVNDSSIFSWDINASGSSYDKLVTSSLIDGDSASGTVFRIVAADATFANAFWSSTRTWTDIFTTDGSNPIANWTDAFTPAVTVVDSSFGSITPSAGSFTITGNSLTWTAVPEPSSALVGLLVGAGLLRRRRA